MSEDHLIEDLHSLDERFADERFCAELYRALAGARLKHRDGGDPVVLSWTAAERLVNELRDHRGLPPLELAQTGGEGEVSGLVTGVLETLGWVAAPRDTREHDPDHRAAMPAREGPADGGPPAWAREGHADAEAEARRR
jgi:hypothetical protein